MTQAFTGGLTRALLSYYDSTGAWTGQQSTLANGSDSGAYNCAQARTANFNYIEAETLRQQGGDKRGQAILFGVPALDTFDLVVDEDDTVLRHLIDGATVNTTNSQFTKSPIHSNKSTPATMGVALMQPMVQTSGAPGFRTLFIPKAHVAIRPGGFQYRGESTVVIQVTPIMGTKAHTGQSYGTGATGLSFGFEDNLGQAYIWYSDNQLYVETQRSDAAATTFTATYLPVSSTITINASKNEMVKNGTPTALSSFNTSTGVVTLAAAGTAADLHVVTYGTNYVTP
jgi:hypothetical protein